MTRSPAPARTLRLVLPAALLAAALAPPPAGGHEFWLAPSRYVAAPGDSIGLSAFVGTGFRGEALPGAPRRTERFLALGASRRDLAATVPEGGATWARLGAEDAAGTLIGFASSFVSIDLPADEFERYLELEGLEGARAERARAGETGRRGRERFRRASKVWIAGAGPAAPGRATTELGLPLEIVPVAEPGTAERLELEVRFAGKPLEGALVRAWRQDLDRGAAPTPAAGRDSVGEHASARTDSRGFVTLRLEGRGEWLVGVVHMVRTADRELADWESTWATLTFARR